jgi:hypothetical protein
MEWNEKSQRNGMKTKKNEKIVGKTRNWNENPNFNGNGMEWEKSRENGIQRKKRNGICN